MADMNQIGLYELFRTWGVSTKTVGRLAEWPDAKLFDLLQAVRGTTTDATVPSDGPFNFVANDSLSGRAVPFSDQASRLENVAQLARFAALYADTLLIRNPFEKYPGPMIMMAESGAVQEVGRHLEPQDLANPRIRQRFVDDVKLTLFLQPLFIAGVVDFCTSSLHWCPSCVRILADRGELAKLIDEPDEVAWQRRIAKIVKRIEELFLKRGTTLVHHHGDHSHATVFLPAGVLEYDEMQVTLELPAHIARKASEPIRLGLRDARMLRLFAGEIDRIVDDISTQNAAANRFNCQYITDRSIDLELMDVVSNRDARAFNRASADALSHPLSFIDQVPLERLLKVRKNDGEAFLVYRDAVRKLLSEAHGKTSKELREAFDDEIRPELNRIDLLLKNARKLTAVSTLTDVAVIAASVSLAAFSGLLPSGLVSPEVVNIGAALGGWEGAKGLALKAARLRSTPKEVSDNRFAFLWKLRREARKL